MWVAGLMSCTLRSMLVLLCCLLLLLCSIELVLFVIAIVYDTLQELYCSASILPISLRSTVSLLFLYCIHIYEYLRTYIHMYTGICDCELNK